MSRAKRTLEDLDEDPEDETYGAATKRPKTVRGSRTPGAHPKKRKTGHKRAEGVVTSDDDDISEDDSSVIYDSELDTSPIETTETGRPKRTTAKAARYEESDSEEHAAEEAEEEPEEDDDDEIRQTLGDRKATTLQPKTRTEDPEDDDDDDDEITQAPGEQTAPTLQRPTHLVKLKIPGLQAELREWTGHKRIKSHDSSAAETRRSSRISNSEVQPLVSLTDSGKHERIERPGSSEPESVAKRPRHGGKKVPTTSVVIEASQEDSGTSKMELEEEEFAQQFVPEGEDDEMSGLLMGIQPASDTAVEPDDAAATVTAGDNHGDDDEDEDEGPVPGHRRLSRESRKVAAESAKLASRLKRKRTDQEDESDFDPGQEDVDDDELSRSPGSKSPQKESQRSEASSMGRRSGRIAAKRTLTERSDSDADLDADELAVEAEDLNKSKREHRRKRKRSLDTRGADAGIIYDAPRRRTRGDRRDYTIRPEMWAAGEDDDQIHQLPVATRRGGAGGTYRSLWETRGPFGLAGGPPASFGQAGGVAAGGADSDSSDDDGQVKAPRGIGGTAGMTPTTIPSLLFPQAPNAEALQGQGGGPANLGKIKDRKALADADPLGVDQNVTFDGVGGLESHINQLKEMVMLPLLYPEVFQRFHVTPPRGVLFHGPPGTGKTLLARALASSVSSHGKKVTFYMRKGADALSKWVGEAEKQLRLLFEEARKNQPSIIFFDEIDGLAPVRSSKQDQIHASIVATLLALMDGMDGRGQVIVIGATNRPDTVDSALRRPGRFDREFYFPLPNEKARRAIIDIHTKGWEPPLQIDFKDQLASLTRGYGGADVRALCTEAALNAVQGTYPQIYQSTEKLLIDPSTIKVLAKDFMISVNRMIPASERSTAPSAAPLSSSAEPLLRDAFGKISAILDDILPDRKQSTALEEAQYDDRDDKVGFEREIMQQNFDRARVFRPRLLIYGVQGAGQQFLGQALLNKFERLHVQSFDLSVLYSDTTRSPEAAVVQLFNEARTHKPSIIYLPNVQLWYETVGPAVLRLFTGLLRSLHPNEPVLLLGIMELETEEARPDPNILRDLFGFSDKSHIHLERSTKQQRHEYYKNLISLISSPPTSFPDPANRKKRNLEQLPVAPLPTTPQKSTTKEELKAQKKHDRNSLNMLKIKLSPIMDQLKRAYKIFRKPPVDPALFQYLYDEQNPEMVNTDLGLEQRQMELDRPYELDTDDKGVPGIREVASGKFYYNLELVTIERRLSNGFYKRHKDFVADIKRLNRDAKTLGDAERILKANEMLANVEVDSNLLLDIQEPALVAECEKVYQRELERARLQADKEPRTEPEGPDAPLLNSNVPVYISGTTTETSGPVMLGELVPGPHSVPQIRAPIAPATSLSNGLSHPSHADRNGYMDSTNDDDQDVHMSNSNDHGDLQSSDPEIHGLQSAPSTEAIKSQKSALTPMAHNSQAEDYHNSASTTTSGQKTSDKSRSSGLNTQSTNGITKGDHPDFSAAPPLAGDSELPDTQEMNYSNSNSHSSPHGSQPSQPSQASPPDYPQQTRPQSTMPPPLPRTGTGSITSLLNNPAEATSAAQQPQPILVLDQKHLDRLHHELVYRSSGFQVEQLEQMNAALMGAVWKRRTEWNRNLLVHACEETFNRVVKDIQHMQGISPNSQSSGEEDAVAN